MPGHRVTMVLRSFDREQGNVGFGDFVSELDAWRRSLFHTEDVVTKGSAGIEWHIVDLRRSSPATIVVEPVLPDDPEFPDRRDEVVAAYFGYWKAFTQEHRVPEELTRPALNAFKDICGGVRQGRVRATISDGSNGSVEVSGDVEALIDSILNEKQTMLGSVEGKLEWVNVHGGTRQVRVYPSVGPNRIDCHIPTHLLGKLKNALMQEVCIYGELAYLARDPFPSSVNATNIEIIPSDDELPSIMAIKGTAPDLFGRVPSEVYIRELRDGEESGN